MLSLSCFIPVMRHVKRSAAHACILHSVNFSAHLNMYYDNANRGNCCPGKGHTHIVNGATACPLNLRSSIPPAPSAHLTSFTYLYIPVTSDLSRPWSQCNAHVHTIYTHILYIYTDKIHYIFPHLACPYSPGSCIENLKRKLLRPL